MSGHKKATITISQKEYQRLHKNELRMRFMREPNPENHEVVRSQAIETYQQNLQELESRQRNFENLVEGFEGHIRDLELETSGVLIEQQSAINSTIVQATEENWNQTQNALQAQQDNINTLLQELSNHIEGRFSQLANQQNAEKINHKTRVEMVLQWITQAHQMLDFIERNYDHNKFASGQIEAFYQTLKLAVDNFENGFLETALSSSQHTYIALSNLRIKLENQQNQWNVLFELAVQKTEKLFTLAIANRTLPGLDMDGNETDTQLDIDFWSARKLSRLINQIQGFTKNLENNANAIQTDELTNRIEIQIPELEKNLEDIVYRARLNALNSQLRINIADLVLQALETQGYSIEDAQYLNQDMRQEYQVKVENLEGNQVLVQVIPNQDCDNELQLHTLNNSARTQYDLRRQTREISSALNHFGLSMGPITEMEQTNLEKTTYRNSRTRQNTTQIKDASWKQYSAI